jgi:hypothetical protein
VRHAETRHRRVKLGKNREFTANHKKITKKWELCWLIDRQKGCKSMKHGYNLLHQASGSAIVGLRIEYRQYGAALVDGGRLHYHVSADVLA